MLSHPPIDLRPFPAIVPESVKRSTAVAARIRSSFAMTAVESLLAMRQTGLVMPGAPTPAESFDDHVARSYIAEHFGDEGLQQYLSLVPEAASLTPQIEAGAWKSSPLSAGLYLKNVIPGGEEFIYGPHLRLMSNCVVDALLGRGKRFMAFCCPYRHGKSILNSVITAIFFQANWPHLRVGLTAHNDALASKFSRWVRDGILENQGKLGFSLSDDQRSIHNFSTTCGGEVWQRSIAGSIQGLGTDVLLVDDPFGSVADGDSQVARDAAWDWFAGAMSRVENEGLIIICTTRWWGDDLFGRLESGYADTEPSLWKFVHLPAIATEDDDAVGRRKGDALWPQKRTLAELEVLQRTTPYAEFQRGYQGVIIENLGIGACYPDWKSSECIRPCEWDFQSPIHCGIDWNADPMSFEMFMIDKRPLPGWTNQFETVAHGLDELLLATTDMSVFAQAIIGRVREHTFRERVRLILHYDQTANRKVVGLREGETAVTILKREIEKIKGSLIAVEWRDVGSNVGVIKRVDSVNSMLKRRELFLDPKQIELAKDFRFVVWKRDQAGRSTGAIDKTRDLARTHASDAAGYALVGTLASPYGLQPLDGAPPGLRAVIGA